MIVWMCSIEIKEKTMKNLILIATLMLSSSLYAQGCSKPDESDDKFESGIEYMDEFYSEDNGLDEAFEQEFNEHIELTKKYYTALNKYLLKNKNINIQLFALHSIFDKNFAEKNGKDVLKQAISLQSDAFVLAQTVKICLSSDELKNWCHQQKIHQVHQQVDPNNLYSYLFAIHADNSEEAEDIIELAAQNSTYADLFYFHGIPAISAAINNFNNDNPEMYTQLLGKDKTSYTELYTNIKQEIRNNNLVAKGIIAKDFDLENSDNSSLLLTLSIKLANIMSFQSIANTCKNAVIEDSCLKIANILERDKTLMGKMVAISLKRTIYQELDNSEELEKLEQKTQAMYTKIGCYNTSPDIHYAQMYNKELMQKYILDAAKFGELTASKNLAFNIYNIEKANGFNPSFNPNDC